MTAAGPSDRHPRIINPQPSKGLPVDRNQTDPIISAAPVIIKKGDPRDDEGEDKRKTPPVVASRPPLGKVIP